MPDQLSNEVTQGAGRFPLAVLQPVGLEHEGNLKNRANLRSDLDSDILPIA